MKDHPIDEMLEETEEDHSSDTIKHSQEMDKPSKKDKPSIVRRNLEEYMEQKALERRLRDVFDDYTFD